MPRPRRVADRSSNTIKIDLSQAQARVLLPEGDYAVKVTKVEQFTAESSGKEALAWTFHTIDDDKRYHDKPLYLNTSLQPQALWNLRNLLEAMGADIPDEAFDLDLDELIGKELVVTVENEEFEGRKRSRITDYMPMEDAGGNGEPEPEPAPRRGSAKKDEPTPRRGRKEPEPEPDLIEAADIRNMDEEQLSDLIKEHELDVNLDDFGTLRRKVNAVIDALESAELLAAE